jgi:hypothetical protein
MVPFVVGVELGQFAGVGAVPAGTDPSPSPNGGRCGWCRGAERIGPGSGGYMRLCRSRPCWTTDMAVRPSCFQVGQHAIDQEKPALAPDPGLKPSVPRTVQRYLRTTAA